MRGPPSPALDRVTGVIYVIKSVPGSCLAAVSRRACSDPPDGVVHPSENCGTCKPRHDADWPAGSRHPQRSYQKAYRDRDQQPECSVARTAAASSRVRAPTPADGHADSQQADEDPSSLPGSLLSAHRISIESELIQGRLMTTTAAPPPNVPRRGRLQVAHHTCFFSGFPRCYRTGESLTT